MFPKIEHPIYELKIPSNKKKIKVRPMLVKEEKILLFAKESGNPTEIFGSIKQVVNNCIQDGAFDINKLAVFDLEYIFLKLRAMSVNNISKLSYQDGEDNKIYDFEVDLNNIDVKFPEKIEKSIKVSNDITLSLKYIEVVNYERLDTMSFDELMIETIETVYDGDKAIQVDEGNKKELKEFLDNLPISASDKMKEFLTKSPSLYYEINYKNSNNSDRKIVMKSLEDFFDLR